MKIETEFDVNDYLYVIRATRYVDCKCFYIEKQVVKEIGKDSKGLYVNIGGVRSNLDQYNIKFFLNYDNASDKLYSLIKDRKYKEINRDLVWDKYVIGKKYIVRR